MDFLALVQQAGFDEVELVWETGFNSSPQTKGVLIRAGKVVAGALRERKISLATGFVPSGVTLARGISGSAAAPT